MTPARLKRFASLSKRARRSITSFSRPRSRSVSSSRVVIVDERSLARGSTHKRTRHKDPNRLVRSETRCPHLATHRRPFARDRIRTRMAIHSSSSSTSARARRAVAQDVASRVKRIDASRQYAAQIIEILVEMTRADDARERRRRARVRERAQIIFACDVVGSSGVFARRARVEDDRNGRRARAGGFSSQRTRDVSD